ERTIWRLSWFSHSTGQKFSVRSLRGFAPARREFGAAINRQLDLRSYVWTCRPKFESVGDSKWAASSRQHACAVHFGPAAYERVGLRRAARRNFDDRSCGFGVEGILGKSINY